MKDLWYTRRAKVLDAADHANPGNGAGVNAQEAEIDAQFCPICFMLLLLGMGTGLLIVTASNVRSGATGAR